MTKTNKSKQFLFFFFFQRKKNRKAKIKNKKSSEMNSSCDDNKKNYCVHICMHGKDIVEYYKGLFGIQTKIRLYKHKWAGQLMHELGP
jgi:hypothetical protein